MNPGFLQSAPRFGAILDALYHNGVVFGAKKGDLDHDFLFGRDASARSGFDSSSEQTGMLCNALLLYEMEIGFVNCV
jgi:hypothetical protein